MQADESELPSRLTPTSRRFTPGIIPQTQFEAQNGATSFVRFGNVPIKSKLQLVYQNIGERDAYEFASLDTTSASYIIEEFGLSEKFKCS